MHTHDLGNTWRGFTLVEMMVTIAVGMILVSIAVPAYSSLVGNSRFDSATQSISMAYRIARSEAVKKTTAMAVRPINQDWNQGVEVWQISPAALVWTSGTPASGTTLSVAVPPATASTQIWISANGAVAQSQEITVTSTTLNQTRNMCVRLSGTLTNGNC
jgi:prepilin-type N-terminal cleavage/methylation domain-containing protein